MPAINASFRLSQKAYPLHPVHIVGGLDVYHRILFLKKTIRGRKQVELCLSL